MRIGTALFASILAIGLCALTPISGTSSSAQAAAAPSPARIDLNVLLLTDSSTSVDYLAWQAALQREGVPVTSMVVSSSTSISASDLSSTLSDGTLEGRYEAIIEAPGSLGLSSASASAIEQYEQNFSVRQITSDVYPSATVGLNAPTTTFSMTSPEAIGSLTSAGQAVFSDLQPTAPITMDTGTYGYEATPLSGVTFSTLVSGPGNSSLVGVYVHPDGVQEMVVTFNENQYQMQAYLLRHGMLAWVTRGVLFGTERNYLETDIDDVFNQDDVWDATTHANNYSTPAGMSTTDVDYAAQWSAANGNFRMDNAFNGGGSNPGIDAEYAKDKADFGWINHTYDHPNVDEGCAPAAYIESEVSQNLTFAQSTLGLTIAPSTDTTSALGAVEPGAVITGEHSGVANLVPGNPGTVDPPTFEDGTPSASDGTLAAGVHTYAIVDDFASGAPQSTASEISVTTTGATGSVVLRWSAVCHAADYAIYRQDAGASTWTLVDAQPATASDFGTTGATILSYTDTGSGTTGTWVPPTTNGAVESAYEQNTELPAAFTELGIQAFGTDASKPYPSPATATFTAPYSGSEFAAGATFTEPNGAQAVPRYPTNIYYNAATEAEEVDEYNYLYLPSPNGVCVNSSTTTCLTAPVTIAQIYDSVVNGGGGMFQHMMGNDPRPDYFHQTNLIGGSSALYYQVMNELLAEYKSLFAVPVEQLTMEQIADLLAEQSTWAAIQAAPSPSVSGYIQGNQLTITNAGSAVEVPLSGVASVGSTYGGTQSGWTSAPAGSSTYTAQITWPVARTMSVALAPASIVADGKSTSTATVTVTDDGYPMAADTVALTTSDPADTIGAVTAAANGTYTATLTSSSTVGPVTVTATDSSVSPSVSAVATLTQKLGAPSTMTVTVAPPSITANGTSTSTATATVEDANGRPLAGEPVTFSASDPAVKIGAVTDHGNGTYTASLTSSTTVHQVHDHGDRRLRFARRHGPGDAQHDCGSGDDRHSRAGACLDRCRREVDEHRHRDGQGRSRPRPGRRSCRPLRQ